MIRDTIKFVLIILLIVIPIRIYVAQPFIVNGASMDPTFRSGEYLIVDQLSYRFDEPKRGDVVVFKYPNDIRQYFIKRIIALPKETIILEDNNIVIYNEEHPEGIILEEPYINIEYFGQNHQQTKLSDSEYFVLGDNRAESSDSRSWGPLKRKLIIGRPLLRLLPPQSFKFMPGV